MSIHIILINLECCVIMFRIHLHFPNKLHFKLNDASIDVAHILFYVDIHKQKQSTIYIATRAYSNAAGSGLQRNLLNKVDQAEAQSLVQ